MSVLRMLSLTTDTDGTLVTWESVVGQSYLLERATNSADSFSLLQSNILGQPGTTTFTDTTATNGEAFHYRVGVPE